MKLNIFLTSISRYPKEGFFIVLGLIFSTLLNSCQFQIQPAEKNLPPGNHGTENNVTPSMTGLITTIPEGFSKELIDVKFREGTDIDHPQELIPNSLLKSIEAIKPLVDYPNKNYYEPNLMKYWFRITLRTGTNPVEFINQLKGFDTVDTVEPAPLVQPPP
jgi:hypothetical protein